jgi:hydroxymethylpyrimidine pyrophosphatase-like HAD family hydrolase
MTRPSRSPSWKISSTFSDVNGTLVTDQKLLTDRTKAAVADRNREDGFAHAIERSILGSAQSGAVVDIARAGDRG